MKVRIELFARHLRLQVQIQVQQFCIHFQLRDWYIRARIMIQLNSTQRASMDAGDKTPQCPHLSSHYFISIL